MRKSLFFALLPLFIFSCKSMPSGIKEPDFLISSIAIIQADLINTQFEAILVIDNPNNFPLELSSIRYELHGNGMFWASGTESEVLYIPAGSSRETKICFPMNFINMNRRTLDDVIRMRLVQYRFKGDAEIKASSRIRSFPMVFDCTGYSEVRQKTDDS